MNKHLTAAMMILLVAAGAASADVIFSNIGADTTVNWATNNTAAGAFTTKSSLANNQLESITVRYGTVSGVTDYTGAMSVWADDGGTPDNSGSALVGPISVTFDDAGNAITGGSQIEGGPTNYTDVTFTLPTALTLQTDTTYWVLASGQNVVRRQTDSTVNEDGATKYDGNYYGADADDGTVGGSSSFALQFEVAAVPEPATMSLLALGGLGALLRRRR